MEWDSIRTIVLISIAVVAVIAASYVAGHFAVMADAVYSPESLAHLFRNASASLNVWKRFLWAFNLVALLIALPLFVLADRSLPKSSQQPGDHGSAHWASENEIKQSGLFARTGIVVGAIKRFGKVRLLRYNGEGHIIVVSPTRSGKGVSVVVPTALTWEHSVLFNDIKGELWALTAGWRKSGLNSICLRFDATCGDGSAARWNPLFEIRPYPHDVRDAQNIALTLASSDSPVSRSDSERHWRVMAARLIKAAILHQLYSGREKTLPACYNLLTCTSRDLESTLNLMLKTQHDPKYGLGWVDPETKNPTATHPAVAHVARDMLSKADRERSSIVSSAVSYLEPFDDPIMAENVSESDFSILDLMNNERPVSLYLNTPVADLERVQPLHRLFFTLAGTLNTEHLDFCEGKPAPKYKHRLLEVFDECAHLGYTPVIQKHFSLASGFGIYGLFVFQDLSQLFELYGRNESITSNCDVKVAFAPNNLETANHLSKLLGTETRQKRGAQTKALLGPSGRAINHSVARALLTPDECSRLPREKSVVLKNGYPPILGDKIPYFEIPELLARSKMAPPVSDKIVSSKPHWSLALDSKSNTINNHHKKKRSSGKKMSPSKETSRRSATESVQVDLFTIKRKK